MASPTLVGGVVTSGFVKGEYSFKYFCVKGKDEPMACYFRDASTGASFKQMGWYFQDCTLVLEKIKSVEFPLRKFQEIIATYNAHCD